MQPFMLIINLPTYHALHTCCYSQESEPRCESYKQGDVAYTFTTCHSRSDCSADKLCCPVEKFPVGLCILKSELGSPGVVPPPPPTSGHNDKVRQPSMVDAK